jgi:HSP20 family protein
MKKILITALILAGCACVSLAVTELTEEDYKDINKLRQKIVRMKREMDTLMKDIIATYPAQGEGLAGGFGQDVKVDVTEDAKNIMVTADLPGMEKDKIDVILEKNKILKISGMRETMTKEEAPGMVRQERSLGKFERILELPSEGMVEGIKATYQNGVLKLVIPKKEESKQEKVKVKVL